MLFYCMNFGTAVVVCPLVVVLPEKCCRTTIASPGFCLLGTGQRAPVLAFSFGDICLKTFLLPPAVAKAHKGPFAPLCAFTNHTPGLKPPFETVQRYFLLTHAPHYV